MAEGTRRTFSRQVGWRMLAVGSDPWLTANPSERAEARAIAAEYQEGARISAEDLAARFAMRMWQVRAARWLALQGGLLERAPNVGYRLTARGRREVAKRHSGVG